MKVSSLLEALREAESQVEAPRRLEAAVLAAWDTAHPRTVEAGPAWTSFRVWQRAGAIAAAATLTFTLTLLGGKLRTGITPALPPDAGMLLLVGEPILQGEPVRVVRMRIPASTLAALGVRGVAGDLVDAVDVDVIVGEDGVARAIRVGM